MNEDRFVIRNRVDSGEINQNFGDVSGGTVSIGGAASGTQSMRSAIEELHHAVAALREHLNDEDRKEVDAAVQQVGSGDGGPELEGPLRKIAGIATMLGELGAPVIRAILTVRGLLPG